MGSLKTNSASNNSFNLGFNIVHRPRLTITLADAFDSVQSKQLYDNQILQTNYKTGLVLQGQFLDYAGTILMTRLSRSSITALAGAQLSP